MTDVSKLSSGVISIAIGVMLLVWPDKTLLVIAALIGILLLLLGASRLWAASAKALPAAVRALRGLAGVVLVILGIAALRHLADSLAVLTVLLGMAWMIGGLAEIASALTGDDSPSGRAGSRGGTIVLGSLDVLAGLVLFLWPRTTLTVVVWVVGIWLIAIGLIQLLLAMWTRRRRLR